MHWNQSRKINDADKLAYFWGLDLGQARDYTALAIIERRGTEKDAYRFKCVHLQRWPLRTPYPNIVSDVVKMVNRPEMLKQQITLAIDNTGVGAPVVDLFRKEKMNAQLEPIQITGGDKVTSEGDVTRVPKRDLVSTVQVNLQNHHLKIVAGLPDAELLTRELSNFKVKITDAANDTYGAWREGDHDDLVLSVALALWTATNKGELWSFSTFRR